MKAAYELADPVSGDPGGVIVDAFADQVRITNKAGQALAYVEVIDGKVTVSLYDAAADDFTDYTIDPQRGAP